MKGHKEEQMHDFTDYANQKEHKKRTKQIFRNILF